MDSFKRKFIDEATELIDKLEITLLELEKNPDNPDLIKQVFRVMHTLKGNSSMFGFELIDHFTHNLETIYDLIRNDKLKLSTNILNVTFAAVDHLKTLLDEDNYDDEDFKTVHHALTLQINELVSDSQSESTIPSEVSRSEKDTLSCYYVLFEPNRDIFSNGTNPIYLLDELAALGNTLPFAHFNRLPSLEQLEPTDCYTYWEVIIATESPVEAIADVFMFVESESKIEIERVARHDLLSDSLFVKEITDIASRKHDIGLMEVKRLVKESERRYNQSKAEAIVKERIGFRDKAASSIRVASDKLDDLMNLVSELVTTQARLSLFSEQTSVPGLAPIVENMQKLSRQLRDIAFSIVLVPIESLFNRFQRLVRDLSVEMAKDIDFVTSGSDTELDKTIIENLSDPIMHIIRNSIDHGIEEPNEREAKGKSPRGKIELKAFYSGTNVIIQVKDDGAGIDPEAIREKAVSKGLVPPERKLSQKEIMDLIFLPGFSTAQKVTDISGRGVGMDVVKKKISDIRGEVEVTSEVDKGTTITIRLPLTLSIIDGLLVEIDHSPYVVPLSVIDKIYAIETDAIYSSFNNIVNLDGKGIPFFSMRKEFDLEPSNQEQEQILVVNFEDASVGLVVDNVIGEYQAVLKPLGRHYKNHDIFSGATILGDGTVALVMDTNKIINMFTTLG